MFKPEFSVPMTRRCRLANDLDRGHQRLISDTDLETVTSHVAMKAIAEPA